MIESGRDEEERKMGRGGVEGRGRLDRGEIGVGRRLGRVRWAWQRDAMGKKAKPRKQERLACGDGFD